MSALHTTTKESTKAYMATLKQEYIQRLTFEDVTQLIDANMQERKANSLRPVTEEQMARHRRITAIAAEFLFVRESEVYKLYLSCNVGQRLENARWHLDPDVSDGTSWRSLAQKLWSSSGSSVATGLIVALGLVWMVFAILSKFRGTASPLPIITPSIDPPAIHNTELSHLALPATAVFDASTYFPAIPTPSSAERYLLGSSLETIPDTDRHLLDAHSAVPMTTIRSTTYLLADDGIDSTSPKTTDQYDHVLPPDYISLRRLPASSLAPPSLHQSIRLQNLHPLHLQTPMSNSKSLSQNLRHDVLPSNRISVGEREQRSESNSKVE